MESDLELIKLRRERNHLRRVFNRHEGTADTQVDLIFLSEKLDRMSILDKAIQEKLLITEPFDETEYEEECNQTDLIKRKWINLKGKIGENAKEKKRESCASNKHNLNLPKIEIRKFDDNPKSWLAFWGQYKKIHEDESMDCETKLQYLTQAMKPDSKARTLVESYPPTEDNYPKIIKTLKERFAKEDILIEIYVRELLQLVITRNCVTLDILYDKISANLQILESLGIVKSKYECILLPMIESALPENILLSWSRVSYTVGDSRLDNLLLFLQKEVEAERRVMIAKTNFIDNSFGGESVPTAACLVSESKVKEKKKWSPPEKQGKENCYFCHKLHNTSECFNAKNYSLEEKKDAIKKKGVCYICLKKGHMAKHCKNFIKCMYCNKHHLIILCPVLHEQAKTCEQKSDKLEVSNHFTSNNKTVALQTLVVKITGDDQVKMVRALLDSGSQRTYVRAALAKELGLQVTGNENLSHSLFGGIKKTAQAHQTYRLQVSNLEDTFKTTMIGLEQDVLCVNLPKVQDKGLIKKLQEQQINLSDADEKVATIKDIDILIGSDNLGSILDNKLVHVNDKLVAVKTKLGWTLQGPIQSNQGVYNSVVYTDFVTPIPDTDESLEFLWNVETLGIKDPYNNDKKVNDIFINISVNKLGRYEVPLLWKEGYPNVEPNWTAAKKRLDSTTKRLSTTGKLEDYDNIIKAWETEGILKLVEKDNKEEGHYLPHHAVIKLESTTTKIRPVFDASSKDKNGISLNMCIEKGSNLIELIPKLLILFRAGTFGVLSDIEKAFLQISVLPEDRKYLKLLWWNDAHTKAEILTYQHARVPFGIACSPYLLAAIIKHHLECYTEAYPETITKLKESFYVDNCVTSLDTKEEVNKFIEESTEIMNKGQFNLRGWMTNSSQEEESVSVLGIQWDRYKDVLYCNLNLKTVPDNMTKRDLLSITQQIFDPIGFLCPMTLVPKLIIQKAWKLKTGWDEKIPDDLEEEYKSWIETLDCLHECKIARRLTEFPLRKCSTTVHIFCDASKNAYAGCIFIRTQHGEQVHIRLISAKSRVAPIKRPMTLPRLELMGALIASRLYHEVVTSGLLSSCKEYKAYCWTDSAVVLAWIQRQDTWKMFVTNRIKEIRTNTDKEDWNHLPGIFNPADLPSRGCNPETLLKTRWWSGPEWLYLKKENWPKSNINNTEKEEEIINSEQNKNVTVNMEILTENFSNNLLHFNQYTKIVRLIARLLRFNPRIRKMFDINTKEIGFQEYKYAEETLIKLIQKENYIQNDKKEKKLVTVEMEGIIKIKTRLQYSEHENSFIYPTLLPGNNEIVYRMVQEMHKKMSHAGTQTLMATLRNSYWITGARKLVKKVVSKCLICKRYTAKQYVVPEPPLPADRIRTTATFEVTGIDLAGPLFLKNNNKCWIVLFTCAVYRAIHLELVESLSTNSFLMALRRFISRRGKPRIIYTDNGTNFLGAANLLRDLNWKEIEEATNINKICWKFSVPSAPWWGGWWERLIRVVKDMLRRILGKTSIDWIELSTILCDCETVINSRPLTYIEMGDVKPLTPIMFLQSLPTGETPELDEIDNRNLNVRYKYLQQLREDFKKRFKTEYLSLLISKGKDDRKEPKVGDLVLMETEQSRLHWPVGIIIEVHKGKDGFTRVARVRTSSGIKVRPYQKLYPLELSTVSQDWLNNIPTTRATTYHPEMTGNVENEIIPLPLVSNTRSGRTIKLPARFMV